MPAWRTFEPSAVTVWTDDSDGLNAGVSDPPNTESAAAKLEVANFERKELPMLARLFRPTDGLTLYGLSLRLICSTAGEELELANTLPVKARMWLMEACSEDPLMNPIVQEKLSANARYAEG